MTFLELPKNTKQGLIFSAPQKGVFTKVEGTDYRAINEKGEEHPITRSDWFMSSKFGSQQKESGETADMGTESTSEESWGTADSWD